MAYVHMNFPGSPRKSYVPHTLFLGFSTLLQNDRNVHMTILHWPGHLWFSVVCGQLLLLIMPKIAYQVKCATKLIYEFAFSKYVSNLKLQIILLKTQIINKLQKWVDTIWIRLYNEDFRNSTSALILFIFSVCKQMHDPFVLPPLHKQ